MTETAVTVHEPPSIDPSADSFRGFEKAFKHHHAQIEDNLKKQGAENR
jgi:hypothetical protein